MKFYSKSTGGFYDAEISGDDIPDDVVEITDETWIELLNGQAEGKIITGDENGYPVLIDPPPPSYEELVQMAENERRRLLAHADAVMLDWRTELMLGEISDANKAKLSAWIAYKNEVKAVDVTIDPAHVKWSTIPEV
ncbi:tail fiber assembly protein [Citrobacter europaeus]|uniref:tail fiber assembly protein n=1 Tax=Citrobacter europaeus TaxID=1914243 RepID=UPI0019006078|nr:tail fiber assembly protein [Citrobacter europaeus]MBJ8823618.1 tail fiber assembly protein [Citrobacter freundii]MDT7086216.1 tail fiber assembly protein [Citrobacter europaeus]